MLVRRKRNKQNSKSEKLTGLLVLPVGLLVSWWTGLFPHAGLRAGLLPIWAACPLSRGAALHRPTWAASAALGRWSAGPPASGPVERALLARSCPAVAAAAGTRRRLPALRAPDRLLRCVCRRCRTAPQAPLPDD